MGKEKEEQTHKVKEKLQVTKLLSKEDWNLNVLWRHLENRNFKGFN